MTEDSLIIMKNAGVDTEGAMARFCGKIEMYQKFLGKFLVEKNYPALWVSLDAKDYENALLHVHTLKGVSGNLGFMKMMEVCAAMVTDLRANKYDELDLHSVAIRREYEKACDLINQVT